MFELKKWEPLRELSGIQRELDDLFRKTFGGITPSFGAEEWKPSVNCYTREGRYIVEADLPGVKPEDLDISVTGNVLTIKGERKAEWEEKKEGHVFHESSYGSFERSMTLPEGVNAEKVHASYRDGVLELTMPAKEAALPRKVKVEVEKESGHKGSKAA